MSTVHNKFSYTTIKGSTESLIKEKGSKFLGYAFHVENEEDIKDCINEIRVLHPKATHHCYAWRLGLDKNSFRINDDGEPSGTAGKPILGQIDRLALTNCLVISVRYFGGTKLGVSGLINAYKLSAKTSLENAVIVTQELYDIWQIECDYENQHLAYQFIHQHSGKVLSQNLQHICSFTVEIPKRLKEQIEHEITDLYSLKIKLYH